MSFIGRAEIETQIILRRLLNPYLIRTQAELTHLISPSEYRMLDKEIQQHKFDMIIFRKKMPKLVVEVNYKHGEKAAKKWREIFDPMMKRFGHETLVIHDYECDSLFLPQDYSKHKLSWNDVIDVINALKTQKISI